MTLLDYIGKSCPYCKADFREGDDIVVCSICEMPHHKECFAENGGCTTFGCAGIIMNPDGAGSSVTGNTINYDETAAPAFRFCTRCGAKNSRADNFCIKCGNRLTDPISMPRTAPGPAADYRQTPPAAAFSTAEGHDERIRKLIKDNVPYYQQHFMQKKLVDWNWGAFLAAPFWLIYRRMYGFGFAGICALLVMACCRNAFQILLLLGGFALIGLFGNAIYRHHLETVSASLDDLPPQAQFQYLAKNSGADNLAAALTAVGTGILMIILFTI